MTTATSPVADTPPATAPGGQSAARIPSRAQRLAWPLLLLLLITGAIALVASAWNISRAQRTLAAHNQQRLALLERQLGSTQTELAALNAHNQRLDTALHALRAELTTLDERTTQTESTAQRQPATPDISHVVTSIRVDQVELLLILAAQHAQHDADVTGARELYAQADAILARLPAADFADVRTTLAAELNALDLHTAATADDDAVNPTAAMPSTTRWWQRALAGWINIHPTAEPAPPPAGPALPAATDGPVLGNTLRQLRIQRRAAPSEHESARKQHQTSPSTVPRQ